MSLSNTENAANFIDRKSFILGMMTAFAECVTGECKKIALSPPFYPEDYDAVVSEPSVLQKNRIHDLNRITGFGILEFDDWYYFEFQYFLCSREAKYNITSKNLCSISADHSPRHHPAK